MSAELCNEALEQHTGHQFIVLWEEPETSVGERVDSAWPPARDSESVRRDEPLPFKHVHMLAYCVARNVQRCGHLIDGQPFLMVEQQGEQIPLAIAERFKHAPVLEGRWESRTGPPVNFAKL